MSAQKDKSAVVPIIELGARAELKIEVKTEVPAESSGRLVDAFTDIIRPFSERRGLKADLIRLHRERVAIEIAKLARQKKIALGEEIAPLSPKFLLPFFEKASVEEDDATMIALWASLLAGARSDADAYDMHCIDLLSRMTSKEAVVLRELLQRVDHLSLMNFRYSASPLFVASLTGAVESAWQKYFSGLRRGAPPNPHDLLAEAIFAIAKVCYFIGAPKTVSLVFDHADALRDMGWDSASMDDSMSFPPWRAASGDEWIPIENLRVLGLVYFTAVRLTAKLDKKKTVSFDVNLMGLSRDGVIFGERLKISD